MGQFIKTAIRNCLRALGYEVRRRPIAVDALERNISADLNKIRPYTMLPEARLVDLYDKVIFCERHDIPGSFVECGVWKGGAAALMALASLAHGKGRRDFHLFDAFQEICQPDPAIDGARAISETRKWLPRAASVDTPTPLKGIYDHMGGPGSIEENRQLLEVKVGYRKDLLHYHAGWFQDTMPRDAHQVREVAILRIDGDWYASTKLCLDHLFVKVVRGGFVIVDDYGTYDGCRRAVDEFIESHGVVAYITYVDSGCVFWIKQ